jgi:hypothetical protein
MARPDAVLLAPGLLIILESKLSWVPDARWELESLYLPLCTTAWPGRDAVMVEAFKHFRPGAVLGERIQLGEAQLASFLLREPGTAPFYSWHYLG